MAKVNNEVFDIMNLATNDHKHKAKMKEDAKKKDIRQVAKAKVVKEPLSRKFTRIFLGEEITDFRSFIIYDILLPAARSMISDIGMSIFSGGSYRKGNKPMYVDYRKASNRSQTNFAKRKGFTNPTFRTREEAREVLDSMADTIEEYDEISVGDLYNMVGFDSTPTDENFGWRSVGMAKIKRSGDGYVIELPRPISLL